MVDRGNMSVGDLVGSQLQGEDGFAGQRSSHFGLCVAVDCGWLRDKSMKRRSGQKCFVVMGGRRNGRSP